MHDEEKTNKHLTPPISFQNAIKNKKASEPVLPIGEQKTNTVNVKMSKEDWLETLKYKNDFMECLKIRGLYSRMINVVRTIKANDARKLMNTPPDKKADVMSDVDLVKRINSLFLTDLKYKLRADDLPMCLLAYPEFAKAYIAGTTDLAILLTEEVIDRLEGCASIENIEAAIKVLQIRDKMQETASKQFNGVKMQLTSAQTDNTISVLLQALDDKDGKAAQVDWDSPDEEVEAWNQTQLEDEDKGES